MTLGLALSGGALRGVAHIGVLQALQEANIPIHMISGCSAGSLIAGIYASGMPVSMLRERALRLDNNILDLNTMGAARAIVSRFTGQRVRMTGIFRGEALNKLAYELTGGLTLDEIPMPLAIVSLDLLSGQAVYFTNGVVSGKDWVIERETLAADAISASSAIPAVFMPRQIGPYLLVDGGAVDSVPSAILRAMGADIVVSVDLGQQEHHAQPPSDILEITTRSYDLMSRKMVDCTNRKATYTISPLVDDIGLFDFTRTEECIERGYDAAKKAIPTLKAAILGATPLRRSTAAARVR